MIGCVVCGGFEGCGQGLLDFLREAVVSTSFGD